MRTPRGIFVLLLALCAISDAQPVNTGGLQKVIHDSTLVGDGTSGSNLSVVGTGGTPTNAYYGFGIDGAVTFDGTTSVLGIAPASSAYTLTRDIMTTTMVVNSGVTIKANGYRIYASTSLTNNGTIQNLQQFAGAGPPYVGTVGNASGGSGGPSVGSGGTANPGSNAQDPQGYTGVGGAGGAGTAGAGGAAGTVTTLTSGWGLSELLTMRSLTGTAFAGGTGGGGGAGGAALGNSGNGGGGGGIVWVGSPTISGTGTFSANGGAGGNTATSGAGAGGGGGGGLIVLVTTTTSPTYTATANGGAGGTASGGGGGVNGTAGTAGRVVTINPGSGTGGGGGVASITCGTGLTGGTITSSGTCAVDFTATQQRISYAGTHFEWQDDWMLPFAQPTSVVNWPLGTSWVAASNAASAYTIDFGSTQRPGIMQMSTGTSTTGWAQVEMSASSADFTSGNWSYEWVGGFPTLSSSGNQYSAVIGFGQDDITANPPNGCYWLYDEGNVATGGVNSSNTNNLEAVCATASTRTIYLLNGTGNCDESFAKGTVAASALTLPNTGILHLLIKMTGTTRAEFYTVVGSTATKVCDINTNIPGSAHQVGAEFLIVKNSGSTAVKMDVDYTDIAVDLTSARSP